MSSPITLQFDDPTIFAKCGGACCQHHNGKKVGEYYAKAYTTRKWKQNPVCENCSSPMVFLYEVEKE